MELEPGFGFNAVLWKVLVLLLPLIMFFVISCVKCQYSTMKPNFTSNLFILVSSVPLPSLATTRKPSAEVSAAAAKGT